MKLTLTLVLLVAGASVVRPDEPSHRSWAYLIDKLVGDGVERATVERAFDDRRMAPFDGLEFSLSPREPRSLYRGFARPASVAAARRCRAAHAEALARAEERYGVSADVIAAIIFVESGCGANTGSSPVLYRLARLAMANAPENLAANIERLTADREREQAVRARAQYLEDVFYPEVRGTFVLAERMHVDPLDFRGSPSGALGSAQFLPGKFVHYGVDGGGDGHIDFDDMADAAASCANYLADHGWRNDLKQTEQRTVLWNYNRSDP